MNTMPAVARATPPEGALHHRWNRIRASLPAIVSVAFVLRVSWILIGHTYRFKAANHNFSFGWEMGSIGAAIASGHGFSNPFGTPTGPTAWEPPLYPYLVAGVFSIFGIYSKVSAFALLTVNSAFSALTCIPIFRISHRIFSEKVAVGSAWAWVLLPNVIFWCTRDVWETSLSALLLALIVWLALMLEDRDGLRPWAEFGLLWGIAALSSTSLLSFLPSAGIWAWYRRSQAGKRSLGGVLLASAIFLGSLAPWLIRNDHVFRKFIFVRDNFGAELRLGNGPGADGTWMEYLHPTQDVYAMRQYESLGELRYIETRKREAMEFIEADYGRFAKLCLKRFVYFWAGPPRPSQSVWINGIKNSLFLASSLLTFWGLVLALRQQKLKAWLLFWLILIYPTIYYAVFTMPRYRHPIEPVMAMLCVFALTEAARASSARG